MPTAQSKRNRFLFLLKTPFLSESQTIFFPIDGSYLVTRKPLLLTNINRQNRGLRSLVLLSLFYVSLSKNTLFSYPSVPRSFTPFVPESECKITTFIRYKPNFQQTFFELFFRHEYTRLTNTPLDKQKKHTPFIHYRTTHAQKTLFIVLHHAQVQHINGFYSFPETPMYNAGSPRIQYKESSDAM